MGKEQNNLFWQTRKWLNTLGTTRCILTGMPSNVDGFVTRTDKKMSAVIWNRSNTTQQLNLKIANANFVTRTNLTVKLASGESFSSS